MQGTRLEDLKTDAQRKYILEKKTVEKFGGKLLITSNKTSSSSKLINSEYIFNNDQLNYLRKIKKKSNIEQLINDLESLKKNNIYIYGEAIIDIYNKLSVLNKSGKESVLNFLETKSSAYLGGVLSVANNISEFVDKVHFNLFGCQKKLPVIYKKKLSKNITKKYVLKNLQLEKGRYIDDYSNKKLIGIYKLNDSFIDSKAEKSN